MQVALEFVIVIGVVVVVFDVFGVAFDKRFPECFPFVSAVCFSHSCYVIGASHGLLLVFVHLLLDHDLGLFFCIFSNFETCLVHLFSCTSHNALLGDHLRRIYFFDVLVSSSCTSASCFD